MKIQKAKQAEVTSGDSKHTGSVNIPETFTNDGVTYNVTSKGNYAFQNCQELTDVYCYAKKAPSTGSYAFKDSYTEYATLYVPRASIEAYKTTAPWSGFDNFKAIEDVTGVKTVSAEGNGIADGKYLKDGNLVIIKNGKEYNAVGAVK